jgi:hypothetical protein
LLLAALPGFLDHAARQNARTDAERIARGDATFREANETIATTAARRLAEGERAAFAEYEAVRANPTYFLVVPGHHQRGVTDEIDRGPAYVVVRKLGKAASTAAELDPRST